MTDRHKKYAALWDIDGRVPQHVKSTNYSPMLLFHVVMNDTASQNLSSFKEDCKALEVQVKSLGAQVTFSFILPLEEREQPEVDV